MKRTKYKEMPRFPGEHEIGGTLVRVPEKSEVENFQRMLIEARMKRKSKL